jgi:AmiR/NasT family two-component response regulator
VRDRDAIIEVLGTREAIAQAVAVLRARHGVSEAVAFEMLMPAGSTELTEIREIAIAVAHGNGPPD